MKKFLLTLGLMLIGFTTPALASHEKIVVHVKGMVCDFCAQAIEKVMSKEPGISNVKISLDDQTVTFTPDHDVKVSDEFITDLMVDSGYDVDHIEHKVN